MLTKTLLNSLLLVATLRFQNESLYKDKILFKRNLINFLHAFFINNGYNYISDNFITSQVVVLLADAIRVLALREMAFFLNLSIMGKMVF